MVPLVEPESEEEKLVYADKDVRKEARLKKREETNGLICSLSAGRTWFILLTIWNGVEMSTKQDRDVEKTYSNSEFVEKLRRLADSIENEERFEIQIAGERVYIPVRATFNIEHEREDGNEEIEFQIKWATEE